MPRVASAETAMERLRQSVPDEVTGGRDTVCVRTPAHPVAKALLSKLGRPIAAPDEPCCAYAAARSVGAARREWTPSVRP